MIAPDAPLLLFSLPFVLGIGGLLAYGFAASAAARHHAVAALLAITLLAGLAGLLSSDAEFTPAQVTRGALAVLVAQLIAAALTDRARLIGLVTAALAGTAAILYALVHPPASLPLIPQSGLLLATLLAAALTGLAGSAWVRMHPARKPVDGLPRAVVYSPWRLVGLALLALGIGLLGWLMEPEEWPRGLCIAAATAGALGLLLAPAPLRLQRGGEGLLAGTVLALMAHGSHEAVACGVLAAICVARGELTAHGLQLDDPAHLIGTLLLPAVGGLLWSGHADFAALADQLHWLGAALLLGGLIGLMLWPLAMATFGLAANARCVREGLDSSAA